MNNPVTMLWDFCQQGKKPKGFDSHEFIALEVD